MAGPGGAATGDVSSNPMAESVHNSTRASPPRLDGERLVIVGGLGAFVASVVPWYRPERFSRGGRTNGWQEPDAILSQGATLLALALVVVVGLAVSGAIRRVQLGQWSWGTLLTGASVVSIGLVVLKLSLNLENTTVGIYLWMVAAATMLYGAYLVRMDEPPPSADPPPSSVASADPARGQSPTARWPETSYLLTGYLQPGADVEPAARSYLEHFGSEPDRLGRLRSELDGLLVSDRPPSERSDLVAAAAPRWAGVDATAVLARLREAMTDERER